MLVYVRPAAVMRMIVTFRNSVASVVANRIRSKASYSCSLKSHWLMATSVLSLFLALHDGDLFCQLPQVHLRTYLEGKGQHSNVMTYQYAC